MYKACVCSTPNDALQVCVCEKQVEQELKRLWVTSVDVLPTSLTQLQLVTDFLGDPALPATPHNRSYAISSLLTHIITETYSRQRRIFISRKHSIPATYDEAIVFIKEDALIGSKEMNEWGYLYYRYVRVDLNISLTNLANVMLTTEQTLRRRKYLAIGILTMKLINEEYIARKVALTKQLNRPDPALVSSSLDEKEGVPH